MRTALVAVQALSFVGLAAELVRTGDLRLAAAQVLLGIVTFLVYT